MNIVIDDLTDPKVHALLQLHVHQMQKHSPADRVFALDLDGLRHPSITFWTAWDGDSLMGCGALAQIGPAHGEVKSMRTAEDHLRRGVAGALLDVIIEAARFRGYERLSLETGSAPAFDPAHALYRRKGFVECDPFGTYVDKTFSRYFALDLIETPTIAPGAELLEQIRTLLGTMVPFASLVGVDICEIGDGCARARLEPRPENLNHIATLHAGAAFTLAEAASGAAMAGVFADRILDIQPVVRTASVRYRRPATGTVVAAARTDRQPDELRTELLTERRVEMTVEVLLRHHEPEASDDDLASVRFDWVVTLR